MEIPEIKKYIAALPLGQQAVVKKLRTIILTGLPNVEEQYKWKMPTYGKYAYIRAVTSHVDLGFYYGALLFDPDGILEGTGKLLRHIKIHNLKDIKATTIMRLLKESVEIGGYLPGTKAMKDTSAVIVDGEHTHDAGCLHEEPEGNGIYL